ncbi:hypothetical protein AAY42_17325 [Flagellimonas eckloniae]|uniref:Uncharacterized protein n=2 Tax=Flagellimonas eckloniae TaxID=346185 RepID=A0A0Q1BL55_9FLAO|nr:hypothetical protein AAY42_17325 [Allomuricauda eckloniae]
MIDDAVRYIAENKNHTITKDSDSELLEKLEYAHIRGFLKLEKSSKFKRYKMAEKGQNLADAEYNHSVISHAGQTNIVNSGNLHMGDNFGNYGQGIKSAKSSINWTKVGAIASVIGIVVVILIAILS